MPDGMHAPTGWVTIVFTDIQGSTGLWERLGDAFHPVLEVHDATVRACLAAHGGYEVKTEGDSFMIAFSSLPAAVRFCLGAQDSLHNADWPAQVLGDPVFRGPRVRMGVHVGDPLCKPDPITGRMDYYGRMVNRAARIGAAGHGGQIVLSSAAYADMGPVDAVITDLGWHALKGFEGRERLWQLTPRRLAQHIFPPPRTLDVRRTNLPAQVSTFVGRGPEFQTIEKLLNSGSRLLTLVGPGGAGKTRLAMRVAGELLADFPGGVWFCDVGNARSVDGICASVAAGLGLHLTGPDPVARIGEALAASERVLILLDDADGVTPHAADTLERWQDEAPGSCFILTARAPIGRVEEQVIPVGPLPVPHELAPRGTAFAGREDAAVREVPSMALFLARTRMARPDLSADTLPQLVEMVQLLRGLPLAVELAAARLERDSPAALLGALRETLGDVETSEDAIEAVLDWAWKQLRPWEKVALEQLAVFAGGFTEEAAEAVLDLRDHPTAPPVMDVLRGLAEQSLLRPVVDDRYTLPVSLVVWLDERIGTGARVGAERRHASWYARMGDDGAIERLERTGSAARWRSFVAERDNLLVATRRALDIRDADIAGRCCIATLLVFDTRGPVSAGMAAAGPVLARGDLPPSLEVRLLLRLARLERQAGRAPQAETLLRRAHARAEAIGDHRFSGIVLNALATVAAECDRLPEAISLVEQALRVHRYEGNRRYEGVALGHLGALYQRCERWEASEVAHREALALLARTGDHRFHGINLGMLGRLHARQGRPAEARRLFEEAIRIHRDHGNERYEAMMLLELGATCAELGDTQEAVRQLEAALPLYRALGGPAGAALVHRTLAQLLLDAGEVSEARRHLQTGLALLGRHSDSLQRARFDAVGGFVAAREGRMDEATARMDASEVQLAAADDLALLAEVAACRAVVAASRGQADLAGRAGERARKLVEHAGASVRKRVDAVLAGVDGTS